MQEYEFVHVYQSDLITLQMIRLIKGMQTMKAPVLLTEHTPELKGATLPEIDAAITGQSEAYGRTSFSVLGDPAIKKQLDDFRVSSLVICGIEAHISIMQTTLDAIEEGYQVAFPEDTISARTLDDKRTAISRMTQEGAKIGTVESILFEMCADTSTEEYKAIAKLVS